MPMKADTVGMPIQPSHDSFLRTRHLMVLAVCWSGLFASIASANENTHTCWVADFREMALTTHNVQQRENKAMTWLRTNAGHCTEEQLLMISSNRPSWMGNADTARVAALIDKELEKRYVRSQRDVRALFDSEETRAETTQVITTPAAPPAVVPGVQGTEVPAAVIVQPPTEGGS
jgi:hypothetical protein